MARILIVDDIFTNRLLLSEIVGDLGHEYLEADNGKKALDLLLANDIDIVFMDIEMPVMNGLETTRNIRETLPVAKRKTPVVALTAHNPDLFFEDYHDAGFDQLLTKPYSINKITSVIDEICGRFHHCQE